jgi:twitching motility two-component system response regulator PilH
MDDVLLIDDNLDTCEILVRTLRLMGHEAMCATGGEQALLYLKQNVPRLVLLDIFMPGLDGYALLKIIRNDSRLSHTPVIVFSGGGEKVLEDALRFGADDFLIKGCASIHDIMTQIAVFLGN